MCKDWELETDQFNGRRPFGSAHFMGSRHEGVNGPEQDNAETGGTPVRQIPGSRGNDLYSRDTSLV